MNPFKGRHFQRDIILWAVRWYCFIVGGPVGDFELLLCHGTVCVVGKIRDLILQLSKSSIYSTKP